MSNRSATRTANPVRPPKHTLGFSLVELLFVVAIIAMLIALMLPAVRTAGPAARRTQCKNNLKQIALALHNYADAYDAFPPAYTLDSDGKPLHSWRTLILPYLGQKGLYDQIDLSKPWNHSANAAAFQASIDVYRCPEADRSANHTTYLAVVTPDSFLRATRSRDRKELLNRARETLLVIEVDVENSVHWMAPTDAGEPLVLGFASDTRLPHAGGVNAAFTDGSVKYLPAGLPAEERRALISFEQSTTGNR